MVTGPAMTLFLLVTLVGVGCGGDTGRSGRNGASTPPTTGGTGAGGTTTTLAMGGAGGSSAGTGGVSLTIEIPNGGATTNSGNDGPQLASGAPSWGEAGGAGGAGGGESGCIPS